MTLPPCDYRVETTEPRLFVCRHSRVRALNNIVVGGVCESCRERVEPCDAPRPIPSTVPVPLARRVHGLGDLVASAIKFATGGLVKPCGGCEGRQHALNQILPIGREPEQLTE